MKRFSPCHSLLVRFLNGARFGADILEEVALAVHMSLEILLDSSHGLLLPESKAAGEEGFLGLEVPVFVPLVVGVVPLIFKVGDGAAGCGEAATGLDVDKDGGGVGVDELSGALVAVEPGHPCSHADNGLELRWNNNVLLTHVLIPALQVLCYKVAN